MTRTSSMYDKFVIRGTQPNPSSHVLLEEEILALELIAESPSHMTMEG